MQRARGQEAGVGAHRVALTEDKHVTAHQLGRRHGLELPATQHVDDAAVIVPRAATAFSALASRV
jgi:hypothetical protein